MVAWRFCWPPKWALQCPRADCDHRGGSFAKRIEVQNPYSRALKAVPLREKRALGCRPSPEVIEVIEEVADA